jgi:D-alanine transaminase
LQAARVPVLDRGFLFADGVYEVVRVYDGRPFELRAHLARLQLSLRGLRLKSPLSAHSLERVIHDLLRGSGYAQARIYIQITRGVAPHRQHLFPRRTEPSLVVYVEGISGDALRWQEKGIAVITVPDQRWKLCHLKTVALLPNVLAREEARRRGAQEALFVGPGNIVREGTSSNLFVLRRGVLRTHPLGAEILAGVSRRVTLEVARAEGLAVREERIRRSSLWSADEVLLSSTSLEITPVVRIDGRRIGSGRPGPVARALLRRFHARVRGKAWKHEGRRPS